MVNLIDAKVRELVARAEDTADAVQMDTYLKALVEHLDTKLQKEERSAPGPQAKNPQEEVAFPAYPLAADGFAQAFDPLTEEAALRACWQTYGLVVGRGVIAPELARYAVQRIQCLLSGLSEGACRLVDPASFASLAKDSHGVGCLTRGFFEVYHDHSLAALRQALRVYLQHVIIWRTTKLWTSFDRYGVKVASADNDQALPLHVDQNPFVHAHFKTTQGLIALADCPVASGCFAIVPASHQVFERYRDAVAARDMAYRGEYVEASWDEALHEALRPHLVPIPLRACDMVTWDSRTTHASLAQQTSSLRLVAFVSAGPARTSEPALRQTRLSAVASGVGANVREALMHASKPPRYADAHKVNHYKEPERLNYLGRLLYGY